MLYVLAGFALLGALGTAGALLAAGGGVSSRRVARRRRVLPPWLRARFAHQRAQDERRRRREPAWAALRPAEHPLVRAA
ncbi:MAG: hypothetical protein KatS3mg102_2200 [Planctomycetota bacterium]|nr:MAG: hypothetical protein KatS3mg102_2200 [Planctomycetota bacterium]